MTVKELIKKLEQFNQDAEIVSITIEDTNRWNYTNEPKLSTSKNKFGEKVWIQ